MANNLAYAQIFQQALDKQVLMDSTTGWMELNAAQVKYNGGNEVRIPNILMDGLGNYDRTSGFVDGAVSLVFQTHALTQDRGRSFSLDAMDVDETNFVATAGNVMGEFQRVHVIPEIDAYRYSRLAGLATGGQTRAKAITSSNILDEFMADLNLMEDLNGNKEMVITMSPVTAGMLAVAAKGYMSTAQLAKGDAYVEVQAFNDYPIVKAPSRLLKTAIVIQDGTTTDQEAGGFIDGEAAAGINWIITTKDAPIAISKTDKVRVFSPDQNQTADAYKIDFRKYHDLWVPTNKLQSIYVNTKA